MTVFEFNLTGTVLLVGGFVILIETLRYPILVYGYG